MSTIFKIAILGIGVIFIAPFMVTAKIHFSDDFQTGFGRADESGHIFGPWYSSGPEEKVYNSSNKQGVQFSGTLGWSDTGTQFFDSVATSFEPLILENVGDRISVTFEYSTLATQNSKVGVRIRLYAFDTDLMSDGSGFGIDIPSGDSSAPIYFMTFSNNKPFGKSPMNKQALGSKTTYTEQAEITFSVTKSGENKCTLSGSYNSIPFSEILTDSSTSMFNAFGISVGSVAHGLVIDNVIIDTNISQFKSIGLITD